MAKLNDEDITGWNLRFGGDGSESVEWGSESAIVEMVVWRLPRSQAGSTHRLKYRLAFVVDGVCVLRYDNESDKGDHKHVGDESGLCLYDSGSPA
jgi:hypothetical protein